MIKEALFTSEEFSNVELDENGRLRISLWFSTRCLDGSACADWIDAVNADAERDTGEDIGFAPWFHLSAVLDGLIESHCVNFDAPKDIIQITPSQRPLFQTMRDELVAMIAKIDTLQYLD